jgi:hypothetical protein
MKVVLHEPLTPSLRAVPLSPLSEPTPEPATTPVPELKPVDDTPDARLRALLASLLAQSEPITPSDILAVLDSMCPSRKKTRKVVPLPGKSGLFDKTPIPSITVGGRYLEDAGFRVSKLVTVRVARNLVVITLDNAGPDPKVDAEYERIAGYRQNMADIYDTMMYGRPVGEILAYAAKMEEEERKSKHEKPGSAPK